MRRLRKLIFSLTLPVLACAPIVAETPSAGPTIYERNVVGLHVTYQFWDEDRPWTKRQPDTRIASAVLVGENLLLTTAQMVDHATFLKIDTFGRSVQAEPRIVHVDRSVNLALLAVDDPDALDGLVPVAVAERTPTAKNLRTVRWRGQRLEAVDSRVIRVEVERSWGNRTHHAFLHMRTDMTGGGWADPVFDGDSLVGITVSQAQQTSRAIPAEILRAFLDREPAADREGVFTAIGVNWQVNRDVSVSRFLGQSGEPQGVLVRQVPWGSSACGVLKPRDILLELGGEPIDAEGYYRHPWLGRIRFTHIMAERFLPGDPVPVRVLRDGEERELTLTARVYPAALDLVPFHGNGPPPYCIGGGLVLRELDVPYLRTWGDEWSKSAPIALLTRYFYQQEGQTPQRRRVVLITSVLPSPYNVGYESLRDEIVASINGRPIGEIGDVIDAFANPQDGFHVIDLAPGSSRGRIVLDAATFEAATAQILEDYQLPEGLRTRNRPLPEGGGECPGDF